MNGVGGKAGWSWIFIMEGILTLLAGFASPWLVQDWPDQNPKFLTPLEQQMVLDRLKADTGLASQGTFHMGVVKRAFMDWKMWTFMFAYIGVAMLFVGVTLTMGTALSAAGLYAGASFAFAGAIFPIESASAFARIWSGLLPYTAFAKLLAEQWMMESAPLQSFRQIAIMLAFLPVGVAIGMPRYITAATRPAMWGRR